MEKISDYTAIIDKATAVTWPAVRTTEENQNPTYLQVKHLVIGPTTDEYTVVQTEQIVDGKLVRATLATFQRDGPEMKKWDDLLFYGPVSFSLAAGNGPVNIRGIQTTTFPATIAPRSWWAGNNFCIVVVVSAVTSMALCTGWIAYKNL